jgi:hypothetical protein
MRKVLTIVSMMLCSCGGQSVAGSAEPAAADAASDSPGEAAKPEAANDGGGPVGPLIAACPAAPPNVGDACAPAGQLCEYGNDFSSNCNAVLHCSPYARWETSSYPGPSCPTSLAPCPIPQQGSCVAPAASCAAQSGLCTCVDTSSGPDIPDAAPPSYSWMCSSPDPACPVWPQRPRIGSACSQPDLVCDYASCGPYGFAFRCDSAGYWTDSFGLVHCGGA